MVKIREIMKKSVVTIDPELTLADVAKIMTNNRVGSVIIMNKTKPIGIITDDDIVGTIAVGKDPKKVKVRDLKKKTKFVTASPDEDVLKVTKRMVKNGIKRVPVIKDGKLLGIVSDKELLLISPELINVLSEKLKMRVSSVASFDQVISGICERCEAYSDDLKNIGGRWLCEECR
ncbi:MAG: CBS domain-containing protein [Candidatus Aenigmatarchaeota archaeon]|nr:MAG: CBS domain-containing protein [Candidatus Aenigmarchaeota archaeon]